MKVDVMIDKKAYTEKPTEMGGIKKRLQNDATPASTTINKLADYLRKGYSICPAVMDGMTAADWRTQQLFLVDIDNNNGDEPILTVENALSICLKNNLPVVLYYHTFSYSETKPKFRLGFLMDEVVDNPNIRQMIVDVLYSLFPQSDPSCKNADRFFLGTNKEVVILDLNGHITTEAILSLNITLASAAASLGSARVREVDFRKDAEFEDLKCKYDFLGYLKEKNGAYKLYDKYIVFENCEICGHHNDLVYYPKTNTFYCFSSNGGLVGGSIIDYLIHAEKLSLSEAIKKFKYELCGLEPETEEWQTPIPFEEVKLSDFPVDCLPMRLKYYVVSLSENTATTIDMSAVSCLAVVASTVQGKIEIMGKADYFEPLNLYILIIAKPGERKSAIVRAITKVIYLYEKKENEKRQYEIDKQETEINVLLKQIENAEKKGEIDEAFRLKNKYRELEKNKVKLLRLIADDVTPEALTSLLADNDGLSTIISTEGGFFDMLAGRYSNYVSIDTVLKAHCGDPIRVDRKGRPTEIIYRPALTMLLTAQENVLEGLLTNEIFKSRGLTARFLYCRPASKIGTRDFRTPKIPHEMEIAYNSLITELLEIPLPQDGKPYQLRVTESAEELLNEFFNWLEPQLAGDLEHTAGWSEKLIGATLRLAGILHCAKNGKSACNLPVPTGAMKRAITLAKYFLEHAKYTYSLMGADKTLQGAKFILKRLQSQPDSELTKYQIFRLCRGYFNKADDVLPALGLLLDYGYLRMQKDDTRTGGRPRGNIYFLNPLYFEK